MPCYKRPYAQAMARSAARTTLQARLLLAAFATVAASSAVSEPVTCPSYGFYSELRDLYDYAWLQWFAFSSDPPTEICRDVPNPDKTDGLKKIPLIPSDISPDDPVLYRWIHNFRQRWELHGNQDELYVHLDRKGNYRYYISCTTVAPDEIRLVASLTEVVQFNFESVEGDRVLRKNNHILFDVGLIATDGYLSQFTGTQRIEVSGIARRVFPLDPDQKQRNEKLFLIRGTNLNPFHLIPNLRAALNSLLDGSCAFRLAWQVVIDLSKEKDYDELTISGHSLGGAAATYIARRHQMNPRAVGKPWRFSSYVFSPLGERNSSDDKPPIDALQSYRIDKDPLGVLPLVHAGRIYTYFPTQSSNLGDRHSIANVQKSLCDCLSGIGTIEITPSR